MSPEEVRCDWTLDPHSAWEYVVIIIAAVPMGGTMGWEKGQACFQGGESRYWHLCPNPLGLILSDSGVGGTAAG